MQPDKFFKIEKKERINPETEFLAIKEKAVKEGKLVYGKDGNFEYAIAPNGQNSNLNERQWVQVRTSFFKDWFGDWENNPESASKTVDENGEPKVWFRITPKEHENKTTFEVSNRKNLQMGPGIYFADKEEIPENTEGVTVSFPCFLNLRNIKFFGKENMFELFNEAKKYAGSDIFYTDLIGPYIVDVLHKKNTAPSQLYSSINNNPIHEIAAFDPKQIKSAIKNCGYFSKNTENIFE